MATDSLIQQLLKKPTKINAKKLKFMLTFETKNGIIKKYQVNMKTYFITI